MKRFKMTHGFPELDFKTTQDNYRQSIKTAAAFTVENLKKEADDAEFRLQYYNENAGELLKSLIQSIHDIPDESEMHADCSTSNELDAAQEANAALIKSLKLAHKYLCKAIADDELKGCVVSVENVEAAIRKQLEDLGEL